MGGLGVGAFLGMNAQPTGIAGLAGYVAGVAGYEDYGHGWG